MAASWLPGFPLTLDAGLKGRGKYLPAGPGELVSTPYREKEELRTPGTGHAGIVTREGVVTNWKAGCGQSPTTLLAKVTQTCLTSHSEQLQLNCPGSPAYMGSSDWVTCRTLFRLCVGPSLTCTSPCSRPGTTPPPVLLKALPHQPHASLPTHHVRRRARLTLFLSTNYLITLV